MDEFLDYNRYTNLDGVEWRIIDFLINSTDTHAESLWKMLKYNTIDCLSQPSVPIKERRAMVYKDDGVSDDKNVFMMPYVNDSWTAQSARLDVFVDRIVPVNQVYSQVNIGFEIIVHNKINNIKNNANEISNPNPGEFNNDDELVIKYKSRATSLLAALLAELNGRDVAGVGTLQHNTQINSYSLTRYQMFNNKDYYGFYTVMTTLMGETSNSPDYGW